MIFAYRFISWFLAEIEFKKEDCKNFYLLTFCLYVKREIIEHGKSLLQKLFIENILFVVLPSITS